MSTPLYAMAKGELKHLVVIGDDKVVAYALQKRLGDFGLLKNADGLWGQKSDNALECYKRMRNIKETGFGADTAKDLINTAPENLLKGFKLDKSEASRLVIYFKLKGYNINSESNQINLCFIRGVGKDFKLDAGTDFKFEDRAVPFRIVNGKPVLMGDYLCTTKPGEYYWNNPMRSEGCAVIKLGQYKAHAVGQHNAQYPSLVQRGTLTVLRGNQRTTDTGDDFGVDIHTTGARGTGGDYSLGDDVGKWSAGCTVLASVDEYFEHFIQLVLADPREKANPGDYLHRATWVGGEELDVIVPGWG